VLRQVVAGQEEVQALRDELIAAIADLPDQLPAPAEAAAAPPIELPEPVDVRAEVEPIVAELHEDLATVLRQVVAGQEEVQALRDELTAAIADLPDQFPAPAEAVTSPLPLGIEDDLAALLRQIGATQLEVEAMRDDLAVVAATSGSGDGLAEALQDDVAALLRQVVAGQEEVQALRDELAAALAELPDLAGAEPSVALLPPELEDDLAALVRQVGATQGEVRALRDDVAVAMSDLVEQMGAPSVSTELEAAVVDLPDLVARELRGELAGVMGDLQDDLAQLMRQVVAAQDEVSQLRAEVAEIPAPADVEVPDMRGDLEAVAAELRGDVEALVGELHDDMATLMRQIIAGQEEVEALREQLAELPAGPGLEMGADLDRLSRDLQALRERIPGAPAATPAARRRRSPSR
jgi:hypothetical protein